MPPPGATTTERAQLPDLLVAHAGGITQVGAGIDWLRGEAAALAIPDGRGGVVFQRGGEVPARRPIEHLATPGAEPTVLVDLSVDEWLELIDVFELDGVPTVAYTHWTRLENDCLPDDEVCAWQYDIAYLMLYDLETGTSVNLGGVGSFESDDHRYRLGDGSYVSVWAPYGEPGSCLGYGPVAELLDGASPDRWLSAQERCRLGPPDACPGDPWCSGSLVADLTPDGAQIVYASGSALEPLQVTVLAGGEVVRSVETEGALPAWIECDGRWIVVGRRSPEGGALPSLLISPDGTAEELEVVGRVSFWVA